MVMVQTGRFDYNNMMDQPSSPTQHNSTLPAKCRCTDDDNANQPDSDITEINSNINPALRDQGPTKSSSDGTAQDTTTGSQSLAIIAKCYTTNNKLTTQQVEDTQCFILASPIPRSQQISDLCSNFRKWAPNEICSYLCSC